MEKEKIKLTQKKAENSPAGGVVVGERDGQTMIYNDASVGGYFVGKTHSKGGIKMINKSNGQPLEVQGSEVIITAPAVADQTKREFEGKMMTNREILSAINEKGGGVAFAKGGDIPKNIKRTGASYKYGGKTMTDHEIYKYITGGHLAEGYSLREIASIHQVPLSELKEQVRMGMKAESEHTSSKKEQMQIVKDHLFENPKYYSLLKKAGLESGGNVENFKYSKEFSGITIYTDIEQKYVGNNYSPFDNKGSFKATVRRGDLENIALESKDLVNFNFKYGVDDWNTIAKKLKDKKITKLELYQVGKTIKTFELKPIIKTFNNGGQTESLVKDAKSGNTPARDLNNYNDVLDIDADGMVGAETSLYVGGGEIENIKSSKDENGNWSGTYLGCKFKLFNLLEGWSYNIYFYSPVMEKEDIYFSDKDFAPFKTKKMAIISLKNEIEEIKKSNDEFNQKRQFEKGGLIAPNGKTSNLTPEQYKLVRTPEFKEWFGDWENDPENASKVVDENGEPLVVYHGTYVENPFYIFDFDKADLGFHFGTYEQAKNRSETKLFFKGRKSIVNSFFLNIKTIFESTDIGEWEYPQRYIDMFVSDGLISESDAKKNGFYRLVQREENKQIREYLLNKYGKFGGFVYNNKYEGKGNSFIVLNPNQIKLADGTNTKFDNMNPDIRYADGGDVKPYDANMEGDSADMMFAEGGAVSPVVDNWNEVPSIWKNTSKVKKVAFTNSPYDKGLYSIVAPFLGNDDLRPIMSGINFDENGITVTDAHKLISLPYPSKEFEGIYEADLSKRVNPEQITISGKYPNYAPIIPESKNTVKYEVDVYKLLQYTNVALKYANKTTFAVNYKIYDEVMGFNGKFLIEALTTLLKLGHDKVYGHFVGYTKAFVFSPNKNYELGNDDLILIMPVMVTGEKYLGAEDMLYGNNRKLSVYYDFNDNEIYNADGSIAEFKMTYASNSVINPDDVNLLQKLANGRNKLPILDYVLVENGVARASDLDSEYYLKGVDLPNGIYKTNKGALEITMEAMDDYPRNPIFVTDEYSLEFSIDSDVLEYYVDKFQNVVGKDDLRPVMQGICLHHTSDNKLFLAGTDANILLKVNITEYVNMPEVFKDMKFIIQPKRLYDFLNSTEHTTLRIKSNLVATTIQSDSWSFYARNIDGNYPNYEAVIPRETSKLAIVNLEPIKKAFNTEMVKNYVKEAYSKDKVFIFNKENEIFIATGTSADNIQKICDTNVNFTLEDYYNENKNVLLIMPYGYDKQTNFAFRKDLLERVFKVVNTNKLDLHYTEMNRAYLIPIDTFDFKATTKEHKVREQKPSAEEIKLVSTINEINEIKEVIESLEILLENANRKDKKEIKETIEGLQILLDTYEY